MWRERGRGTGGLLLGQHRSCEVLTAPGHGAAWREVWMALARTLCVGAGSGALLSLLGCNAAIGGGLVALAGGAGYLASQCYDQVSVRVRDGTGRRMCDAQVSVSDGDSERSLLPCYHASLTEGRWRVNARQAGYLPASSEIEVPAREGACPRYTHTLELTLHRIGAPARTPPPAAPAVPATLPAPAQTTPTAMFPPAPDAPPPAAPSPAAPADAAAPAPPEPEPDATSPPAGVPAPAPEAPPEGGPRG